MEARVIFSKETKELMGKDLSVRQRGKLLFSRLQELDDSGMLSKAKSRADVAAMVGYTTERARAGYSWVSNLINRGNLRETILELSPSGKMVAEYHVIKSPDNDYQETKRHADSKKKRVEQVNKELRRWQDKVAANQTPQAPEPQIAQQVDSTTPIKIVIVRGDIAIKVEIVDYEQVSKLITTILKGE